MQQGSPAEWSRGQAQELFPCRLCPLAHVTELAQRVPLTPGTPMPKPLLAAGSSHCPSELLTASSFLAQPKPKQ